LCSTISKLEKKGTQQEKILKNKKLSSKIHNDGANSNSKSLSGSFKNSVSINISKNENREKLKSPTKKIIQRPKTHMGDSSDKGGLENTNTKDNTFEKSHNKSSLKNQHSYNNSSCKVNEPLN
jgi:hypothetical protein